MKSFVNLSDKSKKRRMESITNSTEELLHVVALRLHADGHRLAATFMRDIITGDPARTLEVKKAWEVYQSNTAAVRPFSPQEAVNILVEAQLTKEK